LSSATRASTVAADVELARAAADANPVAVGALHEVVVELTSFWSALWLR
jgi:hypothetical protein